MTYNVSIKHTISYDLEVEAESFTDAEKLGAEEAVRLGDGIDLAVSPLVPDEVLNYSDSEVTGIFKQ